MRRLVGKLYPDGSFGVSICKELKWEFIDGSEPETEEQRWARIRISVHGVQSVLDFVRGLRGGAGGLPLVSGGQDLSVGLSNDSNYHSGDRDGKSRRGSTGITARGRKLVRAGAERIERTSPPRSVAFLTLTIPALSEEEVKAVSADWSRVCRVMFQWLTRKLVAGGLSGEYVAVTEIQSERAARDGFLPLHLHVAYQGRLSGKGWVLTPEDIRKQWGKVLSATLDRVLPAIELQACENVQVVKKSVSGYLAKYLSKGCEAIALWSASEWAEYLPSSWYSCSVSIKQWFRRETKVLSQSECEAVIDVIDAKLESMVWYGGVIELDVEGDPVPVGWYGALRDGGREALETLFGRSLGVDWGSG